MKPHSCICSACQSSGPNPTQEIHGLMNVFLCQLDDRQKQLYIGLEAQKRGPGSERGLSLIFGWDEQAIAVARREIQQEAGLGDPDVPDEEQQTEACHQAEMERAFKEKMARAVPLHLLQEKMRGFPRWLGNQGRYK